MIYTTNFCINLDRRFDRWTSVQDIFLAQNLKVHRWAAIDAKQYNIYNSYGCFYSHMNLLYFAKSLNMEQILIFEDDVRLCHNFVEKLDNIIKEIPSDWDGLSLHSFKAETKKISTHLCKLKTPMFGTHGILLNRAGINRVLATNYDTHLEEKYFKSLQHFYGLNLNHTMAFQTGEDSDIPETSIIEEYRAFYNKYKYLHSYS